MTGQIKNPVDSTTDESDLIFGFHQTEDPAARCRFSRGFLSNVRVSIARRPGHSAAFPRAVGVDLELLPPGDREGTSEKEKPSPALVSLFLPEFPQRKSPSEDCFQVGSWNLNQTSWRVKVTSTFLLSGSRCYR